MTTGESCKHFIFNVQDIIRACIQNDFYFPPVSLLSLYPQGRQVHPIRLQFLAILCISAQIKSFQRNFISLFFKCEIALLNKYILGKKLFYLICSLPLYCNKNV